jgi:hypothetical protein
VTPEEVLSIEPEVRPARRGWLAVSRPGSALRIGVVGQDEDDARRRFADELKAWAELVAREEPE